MEILKFHFKIALNIYIVMCSIFFPVQFQLILIDKKHLGEERQRDIVLKNSHVLFWERDREKNDCCSRLNIWRDEIMMDFLQGFNILQRKVFIFPNGILFFSATSKAHKMRKLFCIFFSISHSIRTAHIIFACASGVLICIERNDKAQSWFSIQRKMSKKYILLLPLEWKIHHTEHHTHNSIFPYMNACRNVTAVVRKIPSSIPKFRWYFTDGSWSLTHTDVCTQNQSDTVWNPSLYVNQTQPLNFCWEYQIFCF